MMVHSAYRTPNTAKQPASNQQLTTATSVMSTEQRTWAVVRRVTGERPNMIKNPESTIHTAMTFKELYSMKDYSLYERKFQMECQ